MEKELIHAQNYYKFVSENVNIYYKFIKIINDIYSGNLIIRKEKYNLLKDFLHAYIGEIKYQCSRTSGIKHIKNGARRINFTTKYSSTEILKNKEVMEKGCEKSSDFFEDEEIIITYRKMLELFEKIFSEESEKIYLRNNEFLDNVIFRHAIDAYYGLIYDKI